MTAVAQDALVDRRIDAPYPEALLGVQRHVSQADGCTVLRLRLAAGSVLPRHEHEHGQYIHVVTGTLAVTLGAGESSTVTLDEGDAVRLAPWVPHETRAITDSETLEVFSPARGESVVTGRQWNGNDASSDLPNCENRATENWLFLFETERDSVKHYGKDSNSGVRDRRGVHL